MTKLKNFPGRVKIDTADIIVRISNNYNANRGKTESKTVHGDFYRVAVHSTREWEIICLMTHQEDKWAPDKGDGIIVRGEALRAFD